MISLINWERFKDKTINELLKSHYINNVSFGTHSDIVVRIDGTKELISFDYIDIGDIRYICKQRELKQ